jgi:hypothetical protein
LFERKDETQRKKKMKIFPTNVQLEMVERVSNVALQWRLMNFFREFSQPKKHIPLSLSQRVNFLVFGQPPPAH